MILTGVVKVITISCSTMTWGHALTVKATVDCSWCVDCVDSHRSRGARRWALRRSCKPGSL